jgi:hypothetical protein
MAVFRVSPDQLPAALARAARNAGDGVRRGLRVGLERNRAFLKGQGPVYEGHYRNAWQVQTSAAGGEVVNDAPHAGIIELGARPHPVSEEGVEAIREWVRRKVVVIATPKGRTRRLSRAEAETDPEVEEIVRRIVHKLRTVGQAGQFVVRDQLEELGRQVLTEIERGVQAAMERG